MTGRLRCLLVSGLVQHADSRSNLAEGGRLNALALKRACAEVLKPWEMGTIASAQKSGVRQVCDTKGAATLPSDDKELALFKRELPELLPAFKGGALESTGAGIGAGLRFGKFLRRASDCCSSAGLPGRFCGWDAREERSNLG